MKESRKNVVAELALHKYRDVQGYLSSKLDHYKYFASRFHSRQPRTIVTILFHSPMNWATTIVMKVLNFARNDKGGEIASGYAFAMTEREESLEQRLTPTPVVAELALHKHRSVKGYLSSKLDHYKYYTLTRLIDKGRIFVE